MHVHALLLHRNFSRAPGFRRFLPTNRLLADPGLIPGSAGPPLLQIVQGVGQLVVSRVPSQALARVEEDDVVLSVHPGFTQVVQHLRLAVTNSAGSSLAQRIRMFDRSPVTICPMCDPTQSWAASCRTFSRTSDTDPASTTLARPHQPLCACQHLLDRCDEGRAGTGVSSISYSPGSILQLHPSSSWSKRSKIIWSKCKQELECTGGPMSGTAQTSPTTRTLIGSRHFSTYFEAKPPATKQHYNAYLYR